MDRRTYGWKEGHDKKNFFSSIKIFLQLLKSITINSNFRKFYGYGFTEYGIVSCQLDSLVMTQNYVNPKINYVANF